LSASIGVKRERRNLKSQFSGERQDNGNGIGIKRKSSLPEGAECDQMRPSTSATLSVHTLIKAAHLEGVGLKSVEFESPLRTTHSWIRSPFAGCPDVYCRDRNQIVFLQNLMRNPLSISRDYLGTCGGSVEGVHGLPGGSQPLAISSAGGGQL